MTPCGVIEHSIGSGYGLATWALIQYKDVILPV